MKVIYLIGAGRSGTTALASVLNASESICSLGELNHLTSVSLSDNICSCGLDLSACIFWSDFSVELNKFHRTEFIEAQTMLEAHGNVISNCFKPSKTNSRVYDSAHSDLFSAISIYYKREEYIDDIVLLDSAKYVGRAIALAKNKDIDLRVIYMTRDPRGVAASFAKKVQTSKGFISASIYYNAINLLAEIARRTALKGRVCKIRYEDLLDNSNEVLDKIGEHIDVDLSSVKGKIKTKQPLAIGHIVGGNRLKSKGSIILHKADKWSMSYFKTLCVYLMTFPFNIVNKYKL